MKIKKILVPTDFSEEANNALEVAVIIARKADAEISLLNVIDTPTIGNYSSLEIIEEKKDVDPTNLHEAYMLKYMELTNEHFEKAINTYNDVKITKHIVLDSFDKQLFEFITEDKTDLIVMGSKGTSGFKQYWVGSKTQKVIQFAKAPVLTVKTKMDNYDIKNIVFASRFIDVPNKVVDAIKTFQIIFDAKVHFVKVSTAFTFYPSKEINKTIQEFAESNKFENYTVNLYNAENDEDGIREFSDLVDADLTMMITHGRTGLSRLFWGSVAEEVANQSYNPLLTFNGGVK